MTEVLFASPKPYTVNICTAELCKCQEDGVGAEDILQDLLSRDLPYPIDEAPCLGACGGGAMVSIDFEDGACALVSGLDEALMKLGLSPARTVEKEEAVEEEASVDVAFLVDQTYVARHMSSEAGLGEKALPTSNRPSKETKQATKYRDARDRMRIQAANDSVIPTNPWLNAASYLAKKAGEQIFRGSTTKNN